MRLITATVIAVLMWETSLAAGGATHIKFENGNLVVVQNYCAICVDNATACRLACNGSGTCIQACDDKLKECREQNCGARAR